MEHAFGALKGRFQSLWELYIPIGSQKDLDYATNWVLCCIIIHNMVIQLKNRGMGQNQHRDVLLRLGQGRKEV